MKEMPQCQQGTRSFFATDFPYGVCSSNIRIDRFAASVKKIFAVKNLVLRINEENARFDSTSPPFTGFSYVIHLVDDTALFITTTTNYNYKLSYVILPTGVREYFGFRSLLTPSM